MAAKNNIPTLVINRTDFYKSEKILEDLATYQIDFIALAGFLWLIPSYLVKAFDKKMVNIHPALLPSYGGKGMYGMNVHRAVVDNREIETGITIHYVNENYDEGAIIFQAKCAILPTDSAENVAKKIHLLEMEHFPKVVEKLLT